MTSYKKDLDSFDEAYRKRTDISSEIKNSELEKFDKDFITSLKNPNKIGNPSLLYQKVYLIMLVTNHLLIILILLFI